MNSVITYPITGQVPYGSVFSFSVDKAHPPTRLDVYLNMQFPAYSRSFLQGLIDKKLVTINGAFAPKSTIIRPGNHIKIEFTPPLSEPIAKDVAAQLPITVIFKHPHFLIIYKPAGILVHPPHHLKTEASLIDWVLSYDEQIKDVGMVDRPGIVHRLDRDTSGLMIISRTQYAHSVFGNLFRNREIHKTYLALVEGHPPATGTITYAIGRDPLSKVKMRAFNITPQSLRTYRAATTHYAVQTYYDTCALVKLKPITGRTHQIRVHCSAIEHSLIGDSTYGKKSSFIARHALHASELAFTFDGISYSFQSPLPDDMQQVIARQKPLSLP